MTKIPAALRRLVINRSGDRCEYCQLSQAGQIATFHIDHVIPDSAGGETIAENLALACVSCSLKKGARQRIQDPETGDRFRSTSPHLIKSIAILDTIENSQMTKSNSSSNTMTRTLSSSNASTAIAPSAVM